MGFIHPQSAVGHCRAYSGSSTCTGKSHHSTCMNQGFPLPANMGTSLSVMHETRAQTISAGRECCCNNRQWNAEGGHSLRCSVPETVAKVLMPFSPSSSDKRRTTPAVSPVEQTLTSWKSGGLASSGNPQQESAWSHVYIDNANLAERPWKTRRQRRSAPAMTTASAARKLAKHVTLAEASRPEMACVLTSLPSIPLSPAFICQIATLSPLQHIHF